MNIKWYHIIFIIAQALIIYAAARVVAHYSDQRLGQRCTNLHSDEDIEVGQNMATLEMAKNANTPFLNTTIKDALKRDLVEAEYSLAISKEENKDINLDNYFTDDHVKSLRKRLHSDPQLGILSSRYGLTHQLFMELMSIDFKFAILVDSSQVSASVVKTADSRSISLDSAVVRYVLMHQDGYWKIFKKKNLDLVSHSIEELSQQGVHSVPQSELKKIRGINYYPKNTPWHSFWPQYDPYVTQKDLVQIRDLGLNTIRVFIPYIAPQERALMDSVRQGMLHLMDQCQRLQMSVIPCLFDFCPSVDHKEWAQQGLYVDTLVKALSSHPALHSWDIKNEADLDFDLHGKQEVLDWSRYIIYRLRSRDPQHPITLGWAHIENAALLSDALDYISFHSYTTPADLEEAVLGLRQKVGTKGLLASEIGRSSDFGLWNISGSTLQDQAEYYAQWNHLSSTLDLPFLAWTLYDFDSIPQSVVGKLPWKIEPQKEYGMIDQNGSKKPVYAVLQKNIKSQPKKDSKKMLLLGLILVLSAGATQLISKNKIKKS